MESEIEESCSWNGEGGREGGGREGGEGGREGGRGEGGREGEK